MHLLLLPPLLFISLALLFEGAFYFAKDRIIHQQRETGKRSALDFKLTLFGNGTLRWTLKGEKADFSRKGYIEVHRFRGENIRDHLVVFSKRALFDQLNGLIQLTGNVVVIYRGKGYPLRIETGRATVDLKRGIIYSNDKVVIREPGRILVGRGFQYYIKTGKFIILHNVQSFLLSR